MSARARAHEPPVLGGRASRISAISKLQHFLLFLACAHFASSQNWECEDWCVEPCKVLNGNIQVECAGCSEEYGCHPDAPDFHSWEQRNQKYFNMVSTSGVSTRGGGGLQAKGFVVDGPSRGSMPPSSRFGDSPEAQLAPGCVTLRCKRVRQKRHLKRQRELQHERQRTLPAPLPTPRVPPPASRTGMPIERKEVRFTGEARELRQG